MRGLVEPSSNAALDKACEDISVSFTWTAPAEGSGYVSFRFAVVQTTPVYWANQDGGTLLGGLA